MSLNVLIVDDSRTMRSLISKTLKLAGFDIEELLEAADGAEALELMDTSRIDLILSDINMPEMSGIEMVNKMHEKGLLERIPLIILSTEGSEQRILALKEKGIRAFMRKPFTPEALREVIDGVLSAESKRPQSP